MIWERMEGECWKYLGIPRMSWEQKRRRSQRKERYPVCGSAGDTAGWKLSFLELVLEGNPIFRFWMGIGSVRCVGSIKSSPEIGVLIQSSNRRSLLQPAFQHFLPNLFISTFYMGLPIFRFLESEIEIPWNFFGILISFQPFHKPLTTTTENTFLESITTIRTTLFIHHLVRITI